MKNINTITLANTTYQNNANINAEMQNTDYINDYDDWEDEWDD